MIKETRGAAHDDDVTAADEESGGRLLASGTTQKEEACGSQADANNRFGQVVFSIIDVAAHVCSSIVVVVDDARLGLQRHAYQGRQAPTQIANVRWEG